jgi:ATP-dependent helicase HrpB
MPPPSALPIDAVLPALCTALRSSRNVVLRAPTGAGKTTRVPGAILDAGLSGGKQIVMLEPRRLAARAAARRIAQERGVELGGEVGWNVRFDRRASRATKILVVTEGILVRRLQDDPFLEDVGCIVFDEIHERSLDTDLSLAMARKLQREARDDLRLVAMSATLVPDALVKFLGDAPLVESEGRLFPVDVQYLGYDERVPLQRQMAAGVARALEATRGDVLAFFPGVGEIRRTRDELRDIAGRRGAELHELYGDLPPEQQDAVLQRRSARKIVLATNVAQTSVTIDGVTAVVDSGLARVMRFDPSVGLDRLVLERISRASADQRAGRAGRTAPGVCLRLWSEGEQRSLAAEDDPEIRRVDLAGAALELLAWGERDLTQFGWFEAPQSAALERATSLLRRLGALGESGLTQVGQRMSAIPVHPRLARLMLEAVEQGCTSRAALAAALLSERDPFLRGRSRRSASHVGDSDLFDRVQALEAFEDSGSTSSELGELDRGGAHFVLRARDQLVRLVDTNDSRGASKSLARALLAAFPDRLARRREPKGRRGVMAGGRGVVLSEESSVAEAPLFLCLDLDAGARGERAEAVVRIASAVDASWLDSTRVRTSTDGVFDEERERVVAMKRTVFDDLVLEEVLAGVPEPAEASRALCEAASTRLERVLPAADDELWGFVRRVQCLRIWMPELALPAFDNAVLREMLPDLCEGRRSFEELRRAPWLDYVRARIEPRLLATIEREAPERLEVPSGSEIRLVYEPGKAPVLAARIQELFGLAETPRVAAGRVGVLMHLLAPNHRPQQITEDLRSFWDNTYPLVASELRRRYPRHSWPDDPWNAPAERRPKRRNT